MKNTQANMENSYEDLTKNYKMKLALHKFQQVSK